MRLIDADALMAKLTPEDWRTPDERWMPERQIGAIIQNAPTIDAVEVKHGHWEYMQIEDAPMFFKDRWYCSVCNVRQIDGGTNYCPNCGAKMDEVTE